MFQPIFFYLICVVISLLLLLELWKCYLNKTILKSYGSILGYPIIGIVPYILKLDNENVQAFVDNWCDTIKTKPFFTWFGPYICFFIDEAEDFKVILNSERTLAKGYFYEIFNVGSSLVVLPPDKWKIHRRALNPTLSPMMISSFLPIFNEKCKVMVNRMEENVGSTIEMYEIMFKTIAESFLKSSWGLDWQMHGQNGDKIYEYITSYMDLMQQRLQQPWLKWEFLDKLTKAHKTTETMKNGIYSFVRKAIKDKTKEMQEKHSDISIDENESDEKMISRLNWMEKSLKMKSENKFSEQDVEDELFTVLIGATDTTATSVEAVILMLAVHQNYQQICVDELHEIFQDVDEPVRDEHLSQMSFIDIVIKESLRLFPSAPLLARESTDLLQLRDGTCPKGSVFIMNILKMHRNPKFWGENAHLFFPERFLPENFKNTHPYAYVPFMNGPRNCIGQRYASSFMKLALSYLLRNFKFTTDLKYEEVRYKSSLVLKLINKDAVRVERRQW